MKCFIHIGHGKTGSSYIQSSFALSSVRLNRRGIVYPDFSGMLTSAKRGHISSGNLRAKSPPLDRLVRRAKLQNPSAKAILLSSELLFRHFLRGIDELKAIRDLGVEPELLLVIRNPLDHMFSVYQQKIKRGGGVDQIIRTIETYELPAQVASLVRDLNEHEISVHVFNYSAIKADLLACTEHWLGLKPGLLRKPQITTVNRSLNRSELLLQMAFNRYSGRKSAAFISDELCNRLPKIASERPKILKNELENFYVAMEPQIKDANTLLTEAHRYELPPIEEVIKKYVDSGEEEEQVTLTLEQVDVLAQSLSRLIQERS